MRYIMNHAESLTNSWAIDLNQYDESTSDLHNCKIWSVHFEMKQGLWDLNHHDNVYLVIHRESLIIN